MVVVFAVVGALIFYVWFIRAPYRGAKHVINVVNPKSTSEIKNESKEVITTAGKSASSYLIFSFALILGVGIFAFVGTLQIPVLTLITLVIVAVGLYFIYSWAQNRI